MADGVRVAIRVRPGAARTRVGGAYPAGDSTGGAARPALVVAVQAPAVDGRATDAALAALAEALGVPRRAVRLVSGAAARSKVAEVTGDPDGLRRRLAELLGG